MSDTAVLEWVRPLSEIFDLPPSRDIYYAWIPGETSPWLAHYGTHDGQGRPRWQWTGTGLHTLVSADPLHLEASIGLQDCCGRHGFIRNGQWEPAGDGGWRPEAPS